MSLIEINGSMYKASSIVEVKPVRSYNWDSDKRAPSAKYEEQVEEWILERDRGRELRKQKREIEETFENLTLVRKFFGGDYWEPRELESAKEKLAKFNEEAKSNGNRISLLMDFDDMINNPSPNAFAIHYLRRANYLFISEQMELRNIPQYEKPRFTIRINNMTEHMTGTVKRHGSMVGSGRSSSYGLFSSSFSSRSSYRPDKDEIDIRNNMAKEINLEFDTHAEANAERDRIIAEWSKSE